jgi:arginase
MQLLTVSRNTQMAFLMKRVSIIELPFNLGLKEPSPGKEPGVRRLPEWLRQHNFHKRIVPENVKTLHAPAYQMIMDIESEVLNADAIVHYAKEQALLLGGVLATDTFPLVIGGDCSIMVGSALTLKQRGNYALFYLDGHTDFMLPEASQTGGAGGMAAAIVAGLGPEKLTNIQGLSPYIKEEYVWCVGNREYDEEYERTVKDAKATYVDLNSLRALGIDNCVSAFLEMVHTQGLDGFWIHVDVDVLDDDVMPAVDSRTPGGLSYEEFDKLVGLLLSSPKAAGLEITILDLDLDPSGKYTRGFVDHFVTTFNQARKTIASSSS